MEAKPRIIAIVINDVIYDQRMIRICTSLSQTYDVALWGRKRFAKKAKDRPYKQKRFQFIVNNGPLFYLLFNLRIFIQLLFTRFDIIHSVDLDTLAASYLACKLKGKKLVYDSHEYFTEVPELINRPSKQKIWLNLESRILPKLKNCMTVGSLIAKEYKDKYGVPFNVIRNCPYKSDSISTTSSQLPYLLYQGALNKGRGIEASIEAMEELPLQLKIAGTGDLDKELKQLVKNKSLETKVEFLGMLSREDLLPITQNAFAGLNVSENLGLSYYYSLNNKFFDHIHAGIPSVTNPFPEYKLLNQQYETSVFASAKSKEIVNAVKLLLNDKAYYDTLKKNCLLAQQDLSWENEQLKLLTIYSNLA